MRKASLIFSVVLILSFVLTGCNIFEFSIEECGIADLTKRFECNMKEGNGEDMPHLFTEPARIMDNEYSAWTIENNYSFLFDLRDAFSNIVTSDRSKVDIILHSGNTATVSFLLTLKNSLGQIQVIDYKWAVYKEGEKWLINNTNTW